MDIEDAKKMLAILEELKVDDVVSSFITTLQYGYKRKDFFDHVLHFYGFITHENLVMLYCVCMKFNAIEMNHALRRKFPLLQYRVQQEKRKALYESTQGIYGLSGDLIDLIMTFDNEKEEEVVQTTPTATPTASSRFSSYQF